MREKGFIATYLTILCAIFLIVVAVSFVGKRIPTGELEILDPDGGRYEEAGIAKDYDSYRVDDLDAQAEQDRLAALYREREVYVRPVAPDPASSRTAGDRPSAAPASSPSGASAPVSAPAVSSAAPIATGTATGPSAAFVRQSESAFVSKINSRVSFSYPEGAKVSERKPSGSADDSAILFSISMADGHDISVSYGKAAGGCFDPIRSFAVSPGSGMDYRDMYPPSSMIMEGKYQAQRTDEEIGKYALAGSDPARPFIYAASVCAHTPIPSRVRLTSTEYKAGDRELVTAIFDAILANMTL